LRRRAGKHRGLPFLFPSAGIEVVAGRAER
jgi:hypothetical protein